MENARRVAGGERLFAIVGRLLAVFIVIAILVELFSFAALHLYGTFRRDPLIPQQSPAYDKEKWGREFWTEQSTFWSEARSNYFAFTVWSVRKWHGNT